MNRETLSIVITIGLVSGVVAYYMLRWHRERACKRALRGILASVGAQTSTVAYGVAVKLDALARDPVTDPGLRPVLLELSERVKGLHGSAEKGMGAALEAESGAHAGYLPILNG